MRQDYTIPTLLPDQPSVDVNGGLNGFYKSINAGLTWTFLPPVDNILESGQGTNPGGQGNYDLGLLVDPVSKNTVYVGGVNLWGSTDGATTFNPISHWTTSYGATLHGDIHYIARQALTGQFFVANNPPSCKIALSTAAIFFGSVSKSKQI